MRVFKKVPCIIFAIFTVLCYSKEWKKPEKSSQSKNQATVPVVMRGFIYGDDLYVVLLQIRGGSDEQMEEFFRRIKIGE